MATKEVKEQEIKTTEEVVNETVETINVSTTENMANSSQYKNIVKELMARGCKKFSNCRIKNVNFTEKDNYTMVSFTLASLVRGYVSNGNGEYILGQTNTIFTSLYAIVGAIKEDENMAWMANALLQNPSALNLILNGANVDILQQDVISGEMYVNPFSSKTEEEGVPYDHDLIINHVIGFKLSKTGEKMADKLADKLLGF